MDATALLGTAAGTLTTLALLPQVVRIWRSRSADDVSLATFATMSLGITLWTIYGILIRSAPVVVFNIVTLVLAMAIIVLKIRYRRR